MFGGYENIVGVIYDSPEYRLNTNTSPAKNKKAAHSVSSSWLSILYM